MAATWSRVLFRIAATLAAVMLFDQAVFAGQFLSGIYASLDVHRENATYAGLSVIVAALCAVLLWRPGRGPWWPIVAYVALFGLIGLQIFLGFAHALAAHVPLGVAIIMVAAAMAVWSWMARWPR
jgi:hypothetical protein